MSSVPSSRNKATRPVSRRNVGIAEAQRKQALSSSWPQAGVTFTASRGRPE